MITDRIKLKTNFIEHLLKIIKTCRCKKVITFIPQLEYLQDKIKI